MSDMDDLLDGPFPDPVTSPRSAMRMISWLAVNDREALQAAFDMADARDAEALLSTVGTDTAHE